jgi:pyruvate/2-oxoglutarate dehydrogenase complex dihydrolipoamide acyltransferase (E2) component
VLTTTARAAGTADPVWTWGDVVLVGGTVLGTDMGAGTVVVCGTLVVAVVAGGPVVVVRGGVVVVGDVVVVVDGVVVVVDGGGEGSAIAASSPTPAVAANEPRPPPRTSATASPGARGRSLGPTRRTDMGYPLVRSTDGARCSTWFAGVLVRATANCPPGPIHLIVPSAATRARAGPLLAQE